MAQKRARSGRRISSSESIADMRRELGEPDFLADPLHALPAAPVGQVTITGPGAGPHLAGQGPLADIITVARARARNP